MARGRYVYSERNVYASQGVLFPPAFLPITSLLPLSHSSSFSYSHFLGSKRVLEQGGTGHLVRSPGKKSVGLGAYYLPAGSDQGQERLV